MAEVLSYVQYNKEDLVSRVRRAVEAALRDKRLSDCGVGPLHEAVRGGPRGLHVPLAERVGGPAPRGLETPVADATPTTPLTRAAGIEVPLDLRRHVPLQQPRAGGRGVRRPAASASSSRSRSPTSTGTSSAKGCGSSGGSPRKPIGMNALIEQSLEGLPRAHGALGRRRARGRRALLRHLARQPALGGRARVPARAASSTTT